MFKETHHLARPPRLVRRFAVYAGMALVVAALSAFLFVRHYATTRAERTSTFHTQFIADSILRHRLRPSDFSSLVDAGRRAEPDRLARHELLSGDALRVKLYGAGNVVTYASDHSLIGTVPPDAEEVEEARDGSVVTDVTTLNAEGGAGPDDKVLETYVPVRLGGNKPAGVFELYTPYAPIASDARSMFLPLGGGIFLILLGLYASFFPILRRVTRTLVRQVAEIRHKAFHDGLTDLPNRALFNERLREALRSASSGRRSLAVLLIDFDRFKEVNDSLGHQSGDLLLKAVARDLSSLLRPGDTVARLGGDEFGVLARDLDGPAPALELAAELRRGVGRRHVIGGLELEVEASVGIALYPEHGDDVETLLRHADVAMYQSKEVHAPAVYDAENDHYSPARLALISQLRRAISDGELVVYYQPQCKMDSGSVGGVEALVRWQHPEHGLLLPDQFIPLAEHTSLIRPLTLFVLDTALAQCRAWELEGLSLSVAVNITGRDLLDRRFPDEVESLLRRWHVPPSRLELEITENTVLSDPMRARAVLSRLHELGVKVAIDDFGTGNSSLGYLKRLPISVLKVDKSFVTRMIESEDDAVIVRSTVDLGHNLGLKVVAEGVESPEVYRTLRDLGCDIVQGFHLGRPAPASAISAMRRQEKRQMEPGRSRTTDPSPTSTKVGGGSHAPGGSGVHAKPQVQVGRAEGVSSRTP